MGSEFVSKLEEIMEAKEIPVGRSVAFGKYRQFFPEEAIRHPAKMDVNLLEYLLKNYTREGDTVLDPMAGTGSTCVLASLFGRNSICVELEPRFVEWELEAKRIVEESQSLTPKGRITVLQGDARELSKLLRSVDNIITSPPYGKANRGGGIAKNGYSGKYGTDSSLPLRHDRAFSDDPKNISNLPYTEVDSIITPPPYSESMTKRRKGYTVIPELEATREMPQDTEDNNIANLPHGRIDTVITSPPYSESLANENPKRSRNYWKTSGGYQSGRGTETYGENPNNIGNLPYTQVDSIITSPPYEGSLEGTTRHTRGGIASRDPALAQTGTYATTLSFGPPVGYSSNKNNIGNMKKETYLEAMLKVYSEMFTVLRPGGRAIIVVKPFIRNKKVVDLPFQTWLLLERVGFRLVEVLKFRLNYVVFWRVIYYMKFPEIPFIAHEYVLVVEKPDK